jgi:CheY-like chemotaxis protein
MHKQWPVGFALRFSDMTEPENRLLRQLIADHGGQTAKVEIAKEDAEAKLQPQPPTNRPRILVADDDETTLRMVTSVVETQGYETVSARDGLEAFKILQHDSDFVAAIFDMMMPHLLGLEVIQFMKKDERLKDIALGMITGSRDPKIWDDGIAAGVSVFLPKPFTPPQVLMMLRVLISKAA